MNNLITYAGKQFSDDLTATYRLTSGDCLLEMSALSDSLAANSLTFDVDSLDTTLTQYTRNDKMVYSYKGQQIGTFYVQSVERIGARLYRFSALSGVGLLMGKTHYGGLYSGETAAEVIADIVAGTGVNVEIKTIFQEYQLYGWLPIATARDNLAQVLFAIGASLRTMANGTLRVTSLYGGVSWVRGAAQCYTGGSVDYGTPIARVIVTEHRWEQGTESTELFNGAANEGDIIRFDEPVHNLSASGFNILESNCNYAKVSAGTGTLTGTLYQHYMRDITQTVSDSGDDITVSEAYLVSLVNSVGIAERLADYYSNRDVIQQDALWNGQQAGDVVRTAHPYGGTADIFLSSADLTMSGVLKSSEEGLAGYRPPNPESQTYYDYSEVLTGSGEWTVPDGVDNVTAVLIGPGTGGQGGYPGEAGTSGSRGSDSDNWGTYYYLTTGVAGQGGSGGSPGSPGKVFQGTMDVAPGQKIAYSCSPGGAGGAQSSAGSAGSPTTFGEFSSANGSVPDNGYTDPISHVVYANKGSTGTAGGRGSGADAPSLGSPVTNGPNVGGYSPGANGDRNGSVYGGYGGGAAIGSNGGAGTDAPSAIRPGNGGNGANASAPRAKTRIGDGGNGGNGGGGGGGHGSGTNSSAGYPLNGYSGSGGAGSRGGQGGPGGILLYYRKPQSIQSGRFKGRGGQLFFTSGRKIFAV